MHTARAFIAASQITDIMQDLLDHLAEHADVTRTATGAYLQSPIGTAEVRYGVPDVQILLTAPSGDLLAVIRAFVVEHVHEFAGEGVRICWDDAPRLPRRFQNLVVTNVFDVTPRMRRVEFACGDTGALASAGYHVRLSFPSRGD